MKQGQTHGKLSASLTPLWRFVGAGMWGSVVYVALFLFGSEPWQTFGGLCFITPILGYFGWYLLTLRTIWAGKDELEISGLFNKITVLYSEIAEVRHSRWVPTRLIKVVFKGRTPFGMSIHYEFPPGPSSYIGWVPKDVIFLREKIAEAAADKRASQGDVPKAPHDSSSQ